MRNKAERNGAGRSGMRGNGTEKGRGQSKRTRIEATTMKSPIESNLDKTARGNHTTRR